MKKVLVVDDSKAMRMIVVRTLRQAGFDDVQATEAVNGKDALTKLEAEAFDLVLSDWNMPEMSGIELLLSLKGKSLAVKLGFVTSEGTPTMRDQAREAGALFLIGKPFTIEAFQMALRPFLA